LRGFFAVKPAACAGCEHLSAREGGTIGVFALGSERQKKLLSVEKRYAKSATSRK